MTNEQAIERLNFMIQQHICYEEVVLEDDNEDAQEELHETEVELEALRMAVRALESKPRWILCSARMPEMHEEEFLGDVFLESDTLLFSCETGIYCGHRETFEGKSRWETEEGIICDGVDAWMSLPQVYSGSEQK